MVVQPPAPAGGIGPVEVPVSVRRLETQPGSSDPGLVLRRALAAWGLGHLELGESRGWLLLGLEVAWLTVFGLCISLLQTDRWVVTYAILAGFIVVWVAQAVNAYRLARVRSGTNTGAAWLLAVAPFVIALLTGFWLFSGTQASPAATFERYVGAWRHGDPQAGASLFAQPAQALALAARWELQEKLIAARVKELDDADPEFGLDRENPDTNLRFDMHDPAASDANPGPGPVQFDIHVVRLVSVPSTFFGLVPATRTETLVVDTIARAMLVRRPIEGALSASGASVWVIQSIVFTGEP